MSGFGPPPGDGFFDDWLTIFVILLMAILLVLVPLLSVLDLLPSYN